MLDQLEVQLGVAGEHRVLVGCQNPALSGGETWQIR
jgi:hypothetical protein